MKLSDEELDSLQTIKPKVDLLKAIETARARKLKKDWKKVPKQPQPFRIRPSDLGSPCLRKIFYSYTRTKPDFPLKVKSQETFDVGNYMNEMLQSWAMESGKMIPYIDPKTGKIPIHWATGKPDPEFPITVPELDILSGKIDALLKFDNELWMGEFKTIKTEDFDKLKAPLEKHKMQATTYQFFFERNLRQGKYSHIPELKGFSKVAGCIYLYISKDFNSRIDKKQFVEPRQKVDLKPILEKIKAIKIHAKKKELPEPTEDMCFFCDWNKSCKAERNPLNE